MFPTEIVDHILSVLHSDQDYTTLENCSAIFPQIVDRLLYSQITLFIVSDYVKFTVVPSRCPFYHRIEPTYYVVDPTKFSGMLVERPHVANYVRVIQIIMKVMLSPSLSFPSQQFRDGISVTSSILSSLPLIESIMVSSPIRKVSWAMLGPEFCTAFGSSVRLPSIKSIAISNMEDLSLDHFDDCKDLRNLFLDGRFINGETVSTSPYPCLRSLHVDSHPDLTRVVSWMKSNTLRTLSLRLHSGYSLPNFRTLIEACSPTLVKLDINHNYNYLRRPFTHFVFPDLQLPFLDHFIFRSPIEKPAFANITPLSLLLPFLQSIKSISSLSPIYLTLHILIIYHFVDLSPLTPILILPIFRHPIELHFTYNRTLGVDVVFLLERNSNLKRLLEDRKVVVISNEIE